MAGARPSELAYLLSLGLPLIEARRLAESPRPHLRREGRRIPAPLPILQQQGSPLQPFSAQALPRDLNPPGAEARQPFLLLHQARGICPP